MSITGTPMRVKDSRETEAHSNLKEHVDTNQISELSPKERKKVEDLLDEE